MSKNIKTGEQISEECRWNSKGNWLNNKKKRWVPLDWLEDTVSLMKKGDYANTQYCKALSNLLKILDEEQQE